MIEMSEAGNTTEGDTPTTVTLIDALLAVERLNSWVRSPSARGYGQSIKHAIYWLKRCALVAVEEESARQSAAVREGEPTFDRERVRVYHYNVAVIVECRDCRGTKRYVDDNGYEHATCRECSSSGQVILYFVVSNIQVGWHAIISWHTPADRFPPLKRPESLPSRTSWTPNQPGGDLTLSELAQDLNTAEGFFAARPPKRWVGYGFDQGEYVDDFAYSLRLGIAPANACRLCGATDDLLVGSTWTLGSGFAWGSRVCRACHDKYDIFDELRALKPHPDLLADEHVRAWINRRHREEALTIAVTTAAGANQ